ncbi:DNA cytosine methyltransferase [Mycolicibacterium tokaiense]|uniref:DNA cytosine methyltransferase n=1 Tax=Mycolicibacterium tokaiense TaxID=39695 RepID=UPI00338ED989
MSLFSGAGGFDIALERAGWNVVTATDVASDAMDTLRASKLAKIAIRGRRGRHLAKTRLIEADVATLTATDLRPALADADWRPDLLAGGPPCQPWSSAGHQKGLNDARGKLIWHMIRLVSELQPRYVLFENVRGLVTATGATASPGEVLRSIQEDFRELGYSSRIATLNAADYGAPQRRVRLYLIASKDHELPDFPNPTHHQLGLNGLKPWVTLGELLDSVPPPADNEVVVRPSGKWETELRELTPGTGIRTVGRVMNNRPSGQWGYRQDGFLADLGRPSRTIRAAPTPDWIKLPGDDLRRLTWKECAALQGFPLSWEFCSNSGGLFRLIGNAVQIDAVEAIGRNLLDSLRKGPLDEPPPMPPWPDYLVRRVRGTEAEHRVNGALRTRIHTKSNRAVCDAT